MRADINLKLLTATEQEKADLQRILEASPRYFERILNSPAGPQEAEETMSILPPRITAERKFNLGIYLGNLMVGYADVIRGYPQDEIAYIGLMIFDEAYHQQGIGKKSFQLIEEFIGLSWPEIIRLQLGVADTNDVIGFWKKMGFELTGKIKPCLEPKIKASIIEMHKPLPVLSKT